MLNFMALYWPQGRKKRYHQNFATLGADYKYIRTILCNEVSVLEFVFSDSWYGSPLIFSEMNFHHFDKKKS
jgi:hypothetical protein